MVISVPLTIPQKPLIAASAGEHLALSEVARTRRLASPHWPGPALLTAFLQVVSHL